MNRVPIELEAKGVNFWYGDHQALHDISVMVRPNDRIGIVGESGSGKSTLARLLVGLRSPQQGAVTVNGRSWSRVKRSEALRRSVQMIQQDPYASLSPHLTARSTVREAVQQCQRLSRSEADEKAVDLLDGVGLNAGAIGSRPKRLSGGQCQRVAVARALAAEPGLLIADEPTSALDLSVQAQIINLILKVMTEAAMTLVLVSHDLGVVRHLTDHIVVMRQGCIVEQGPTREILARPQHPYTQELVDAALWSVAASAPRDAGGHRGPPLLSVRSNTT